MQAQLAAQQQAGQQRAALGGGMAPVAPAPAMGGFDQSAVISQLRAPAAMGNASPVSSFAAGPQMQGNPAPRLSAPMGGLAGPQPIGKPGPAPQPVGQPRPLGAPGMGGFGGFAGKPAPSKFGGKGGGGVGGGGKGRTQPVPQFRSFQ